jgi:hypothetical protein
MLAAATESMPMNSSWDQWRSCCWNLEGASHLRGRRGVGDQLLGVREEIEEGKATAAGAAAPGVEANCGSRIYSSSISE